MFLLSSVIILSQIQRQKAIINQDLFGVVIFMTLVTTLVAPPILSLSLTIKGRGTRKEVSSSETQQFQWDFKNHELTHLVLDILYRDLQEVIQEPFFLFFLLFHCLNIP